MIGTVNEIMQGDCLERLPELDSESVNLCVTSPLYNAGIDYGEGIEDAMPWPEYEAWARQWVGEVERVLCDGGRLCVNVAAVMGRSPAYPLAAYYAWAIRDAGLLYRGEIIWDKGPSRNNSTAWGSWRSPGNPSLRDSHEVILVASKGAFGLPNPRGEESDLTPEEFTRDTRSLWRVPCETDRTHPAPFPVALAERLIKLYSWPNDVVLDPFAGSGTTLVAADRLGRKGIGIELSPIYAALIEERLRRQREQQRLQF